MKWTFDQARPIYLQIVEILKADIIAQKYTAGEKFPSVRELAEIASVNPNTMQKALVQLEQDGLLITNRASGRLVTSHTSIIMKEKEKLAKEKVSGFLGEMTGLGYTKQETITFIEEETTWQS